MTDPVVVVRVPTIVTVAAPGPQGPPGVGGSGFSASVVGGVLTVSITSNWGVASDGHPYYDPNGAVPGEAAVASLTDTGAFVLTRPAGS